MLKAESFLKVVRSALQNAASISGLMLTNETLVTDLNKEDKESVASRAFDSTAVARVR